MVEFPPPATSSAAEPGEPGYAPPPDRPSFVFPPPRQSSGSVRDAGRYVGEKLRDVTDTADWAAETSFNQGEVLADYGAALERKVEPWAVPTVAPLSQTINRRADATIQLSDFMSPMVRGRSDAAGHNHQHDTTSSVHALAEGWNVGQRTYLAFITPAINRAYEEVWFMVGALADVNAPAANMDVAIYVADENRVLRSQIGTHRVSATIGPGRQLVSVKFDTWVAIQGSYIAVAVRQWTGNTRPLLGLNEAPRPLSNVIFPRKITAQWSSGSALPGTIDGTSELDFEADWFTPYIELSEAIGVDYRSFTEAWPDEGSQRGRPWVPLTSQGIGSSGGYTAAYGVGLRVSMYDTPLSTDHVRVQSSIRSVQSGSHTTPRRSTLIVRGTNDLRTGLGLSAVHGTRYELIRWTNLAVDADEEWNNRTVLATVNLVPSAGHQIQVDYLDGVVDVYIGGVKRIDGLVVSGLSGPAYRFLGIQNRRQAFITANWSPWFGPWSARDLPQAGSGGDDDHGDGDGS